MEQYGRGEGYRLIEMPSEETMLEQVGGVVAGTIGLLLPENLAAVIESQGPLEIEAYYSHAMRGSEAEELMAFFRRELSAILGREVVLNSAGNEVYPAPDAGGHPLMISIALVASVMTIGMALVPLLMIEEKERRTIEAMLVSPASYSQIVLGKALAGMFYCLVAGAVVYVLNNRLLATGWLALLALLDAALFTVALGLLFGVLFEQPTNMNMVMAVVLMLLLVPMLISMATLTGLPSAVQALLPWLPSLAMRKLFSMSFSNAINVGALLFNLGVLFGLALVLLLLVVWRVRRMDR